jgi:hypothetical protein
MNNSPTIAQRTFQSVALFIVLSFLNYRGLAFISVLKMALSAKGILGISSYAIRA